jgi:hypothetical protein
MVTTLEFIFCFLGGSPVPGLFLQGSRQRADYSGQQGEILDLSIFFTYRYLLFTKKVVKDDEGYFSPYILFISLRQE